MKMRDRKGPMKVRKWTQFRLGSVLVAVLFCALAAAWFSDRSHLKERIRQLSSRIATQEEQIARLQHRLAVRLEHAQTRYTWANADEFIEMIRTVADEETFNDKGPSLLEAEQPLIDDVVPRLIELLESKNERTVERALTTLQWIQQHAPEKIASHSSQVVTGIGPLLSSEHERIVAMSMYTLSSFGTASRGMLPELQTLMNDDDAWLAPDAAIAIARIDPHERQVVALRLVELIEMKHPNWYQAAFHLPQVADSDVARSVLEDAYADAETDAEREMATIALNQLPSVTEPE